MSIFPNPSPGSGSEPTVYASPGASRRAASCCSAARSTRLLRTAAAVLSAASSTGPRQRRIGMEIWDCVRYSWPR